MPNLDDELRRRMQSAGRRVDGDGLEARLHARRAHKQITQKVGRGFLAVAVLAGSALGVAGLNRAFRGDAGEQPTGVSGTIAYLRMVRSCEPAIDRPSTDVVALEIATGELRVVRSTRFFTDNSRPIAERAPEFSPDGSKMAWADQYGYDLEVTDVATGHTEQVTHGLSVGAPHWSPDGTKLLFAAGEKTGDLSPQGSFREGPDAVYTMNADGSDLTKLTEGTLPIWSPDGRIAFIRTGTTSLDLTDPQSRTEFGPTSFYIMNADGSGIDKVYEAPADVPIRDAEWSPDGSKIAGEATLRGNTDIFVVDLTLRTSIRLTDDPRQDTSPTWSPDGTMIAFQTGRWMGSSSFGEVGHSEIAVMNADGSDVRRITADCADDYDPTWLAKDSVVRTLPISGLSGRPDLGDAHVPDPSDILLGRQVGNFSDLFALDPETGTLTNLTADFASQGTPAWSPDHSQIAFSGDVDEPGNYDIYVMNADGSNVRRLTTDPEGEARPSWAPDGSTLAFEGRGGVWTVSVDGSELRRIIDDRAGGGLYPSWSPDGTSIAYSSDGTILVFDLANGESRSLGGKDAYEVEWSPDGTKLLFTCERDICVMDADGGNVVNLTAEADVDTYEREANWSPDGTQIVFMSDRGSEGLRVYVMNADGSAIQPVGPPNEGAEPDW
jgi:Tol biopolymer transport system component